MPLHVHVAPHPDALVARLCDDLADPPEDPFTPELIAVPTRGIERWLTQRIASELAARGIGDGIAANIDFPSPRQLVRETLLAVPELAASVQAWQSDDLTSHVLAAVDDHADEPWLRLIQRYIETPGPNRLTAATKIARLFSAYARRRPEMIRSWAAGADVGPSGDPIRDGDAWQPRLWRLVRETIGIPALAELLPAGLDPIRTGTIDLGLPDRLAAYGLTATDPLDLEVLQALGHQCDVHLYVLHPSPALWKSVAYRIPATPTGRNSDPTVDLPAHPLLASWGRDSRELQSVLAGANLPGTTVPTTSSSTDTLLTCIQDDIRMNRPVAFAADLAAATTGGADRSVQIHVAHGARRQVEITRDAILHILAADPTLQPRDVVIMTPDLATFAPLLEAAFPASDGKDGLPDLRLRIADRSPAAINPMVRFAATVLDLAGSRLEAGRIRELVTREVVRQRFGFDLDTAAAITSIIDDGRISWGIDGVHRAAWQAGSNDERTWSRGLERALAGVFYSDDPVRVVGDNVPMAGIEGQEATPVGLLAAIIDRIVTISQMLAEPMPASQWGRGISAAVRLLASPGWDEEWQLSQFERLLAETFPEPAPGGPDPVLSIAEAHVAVSRWTETRPSPLHFRTGDVTVCTLVPMRSVPYRVVCLLGMDDARFPRSSRTDGDDLLIDHEIIGDFDRSAEDRQLLLDAVMAAGDHLIVTYSGRDELTNSELPPAVPIAELYDTLADMVGPAGVEAIETVHPLQSFSEVNFTPGALDLPGPFGFDPIAHTGARAVTGQLDQEPDVAAAWPDPDPEPIDTVDLDDLIRFLQHPMQGFMKTRMGFSVPDAGETPDDTLPADLDALRSWGLKERLLDGMADGYDLDQLSAHELAGDGLPPGALGSDDLEAATEAATALWEGAVERGYDRARMQPYRGSIQIPGVAVTGSVQANPARAHLARVTASRVKGKHRLRVFAELVFLSALEPDIAWESFLLGRKPRYGGHLAVTIGPIGEDTESRHRRAMEMLETLVGLYGEGLRNPLPLPCETGLAWRRNVGNNRGAAFREALETWERDRFSPEAADPAHVMLLGDVLSLSELLDTGFEDYCARLWGPIIPLSREKNL
jgi:exodeoxyribonuclease V gamma subunit